MSIPALFTLAIGLSMDAFAVSVCRGLASKEISAGAMGLTGLWFGGFQALMPLIGYLLGIGFRNQISAFDHWIAFVLPTLIGLNMIRESRSAEKENAREAAVGETEETAGETAEEKPEEADSSLAPRTMFMLAVATSIDALAVGVTFAFLNVNILAAISLIGITTFLISASGIKIGSLFGSRCKSGAELFGGLILILIGAKILMEHLGAL